MAILVPQSLADPIVLEDITIPGRVVFSPINTGLAQDARPDSRMVQFHRVRAGPGIGIAIVGNVAVSADSRTNENTIVLASASDVRGVAAVARAIEETGTLPGIQLAFSPPGLNPRPAWRCADKDAEVHRLRKLVASVPEAQMHKLIDAFVSSAQLAVDSGFRVIQIHAAHGYLLSLMLSKYLNGRIGGFSADGEWLEVFIGRLSDVCVGRLVSIRISVVHGIGDLDTEVQEALALADRLDAAGVGLIDVSAGLYTLTRELIYPKGGGGDVPYLRHGTKMAQRVSCLVCVAGGIRFFDALPSIPDNLLIGVGRPLLADPGFVRKYLADESHTIQHCKNRGKCHYFTRGESHISCGVNPSLGTRQE